MSTDKGGGKSQVKRSVARGWAGVGPEKKGWDGEKEAGERVYTGTGRCASVCVRVCVGVCEGEEDLGRKCEFEKGYSL